MNTDRAQVGWGCWLERAGILISLIIGAIAIYLSVDANRIARESVSPRIFVHDVNLAGFFAMTVDNPEFFEELAWDPKNLARCSTQIRLSNLGGAATAIVGFEVLVQRGEREISADSEGGSQASSDKSVADGFGSLISYFVKSEDAGRSFSLQADRQALPINVEEYTTLDLFNETLFIGHRITSETFDESVTNAFGVSELSYWLAGSELIPELSYRLQLANGEIIMTPGVRCSFTPP